LDAVGGTEMQGVESPTESRTRVGADGVEITPGSTQMVPGPPGLPGAGKSPLPPQAAMRVKA
jgi:hypothetical protein